MKKFFPILLICILLFSSSCATLFTGTSQKVEIDSNPPGADILIDGQKFGVTPSEIKLDKDFNDLLDGGKNIRLVLEGYEKSRFEIDAELNPIAILNLFNVLFWGIDAVTGAIVRYDDYVKFELNKLYPN